MKDEVEVWNIDDSIHLPYGSDKEVFEEIKRNVLELAKSIKR